MTRMLADDAERLPSTRYNPTWYNTHVPNRSGPELFEGFSCASVYILHGTYFCIWICGRRMYGISKNGHP
jgi:hypothetical protein